MAYAVDGDVYCQVGRFPPYGRLSGQCIDELRSGARVEMDERKRSPVDFALWKAAKPGEPSWHAPWNGDEIEQVKARRPTREWDAALGKGFVDGEKLTEFVYASLMSRRPARRTSRPA